MRSMTRASLSTLLVASVLACTCLAEPLEWTGGSWRMAAMRPRAAIASPIAAPAARLIAEYPTAISSWAAPMPTALRTLTVERAVAAPVATVATVARPAAMIATRELVHTTRALPTVMRRTTSWSAAPAIAAAPIAAETRLIAARPFGLPAYPAEMMRAPRILHGGQPPFSMVSSYVLPPMREHFRASYNWGPELRMAAAPAILAPAAPIISPAPAAYMSSWAPARDWSGSHLEKTQQADWSAQKTAPAPAQVVAEPVQVAAPVVEAPAQQAVAVQAPAVQVEARAAEPVVQAAPAPAQQEAAPVVAAPAQQEAAPVVAAPAQQEAAQVVAAHAAAAPAAVIQETAQAAATPASTAQETAQATSMNYVENMEPEEYQSN